MQIKFDKRELNSASQKNTLHFCVVNNVSAFYPVETLELFRQSYNKHFLLESADEDKQFSRYSVIGLGTNFVWKCNQEEAFVSEDGVNFTKQEDTSLVSLKKLIRNNTLTNDSQLPPMANGIFGFIGYDCIRLIENIPNKNKDDINIDDAVLFEPKILIIFDNKENKLFVINKINAQEETKSEEFLTKIVEQISKVDLQTFSYNKSVDNIKFESNYSQQQYEDMVIKAKDYITEGDIFQIVPSQRLTAEYKKDKLNFYKVLRELNPSPFLFYINFGEYVICGSSPEILVRLRNNKITVKPLAGTIKRGDNEQQDKANEQELLNNSKEVAEHLMLLDLGRNDVGKVCKGGEVKVTERMLIERYSHVMHISSTVEGQIDDQKFDAVDALLAGFPAGTTSGAPKVRAMEIIDELENTQRKFYSGAIGYFNGNEMDSCIALRTALFKDNKIYIQAGAGVVYDSEPEMEYNETMNKALALIRSASISLAIK